MTARLMTLGFLGFLLATGGAQAQKNAQPDPGTVEKYRGQNGKVFYFEVTGSTKGSVWGSGPYTDDSSLATAAVHAGLVKDGEKGTVRVTILAGRDSYQGTEKNGVTSSNWPTHGGSFRLEGLAVHDPKVRPDPGTLGDFRGQSGKSFVFEVIGKTDGTAYGTGIYTDDSILAKVAVHAGILKAGQKGLVKVIILPGQAKYEGSTRNGAATMSWTTAWDGSYRVEAVKK